MEKIKTVKKTTLVEKSKQKKMKNSKSKKIKK